MGSQESEQQSEYPTLERMQWRSAAFEKAAVGLAIVSLDGAILESNVAFQKLFGYSVEEMHRKTVQEISHPKDLEQDVALLEEIVSGARDSYEMDKRYYHKDGHLFWGHLMVSLVRDHHGLPAYAIGSVTDITAQKRLQQENEAFTHDLERQVQERTREIQEQETMYRNLFEYAGVGMARVYPNEDIGTISHTNKAVQRFFDYTDEEMAALTVKDISQSDDFETDKARLLKLVAGEISSYQMEKRYFRKDGEMVWGLITVSLVRDCGGKPHYTVATLQDITARKEAEEDLQRYSGELEQQVDWLSDQRAKRENNKDSEGQIWTPDSVDVPHTLLTKRQLQVLKLYAKNWSNLAMAKKFKVTARTIERDVQQIKIQMKLLTRASLTRYAMEHNLI